jgi:hypothetical protein
MFNLEQAVANWRRQLIIAGIKAPVPMEELEIHLREEIERQMQSGLSAQPAFGIAVEKIGQAPELKGEFKKISPPMEMPEIIRLAGVICVAVALFCQVFTCSPIVFAFLFAHGLKVSLMTRLLPFAAWALTVATTVLSWKYNHKLLPVIHNQLLRGAIGIMCYVGCLLWIRFVLFHLPKGVAEDFSLGNLLLVTFLLGSEWTVMGILGGIGHGLEKAASKKLEPIDLLAGQS